LDQDAMGEVSMIEPPEKELSRSRLLQLGLAAAAAALAPPGAERAFPSQAFAQGQDPLRSWNDRPVKQAILEYIRATTDASSPKFVPPEHYGPALGLPDKQGRHIHAGFDEAKTKGRLVISMKKDWKRIFAFET
jgi:hypothetical protein